MNETSDILPQGVLFTNEQIQHYQNKLYDIEVSEWFGPGFRNFINNDVIGA